MSGSNEKRLTDWQRLPVPTLMRRRPLIIGRAIQVRRSVTIYFRVYKLDTS